MAVSGAMEKMFASNAIPLNIISMASLRLVNSAVLSMLIAFNAQAYLLAPNVNLANTSSMIQEPALGVSILSSDAIHVPIVRPAKNASRSSISSKIKPVPNAIRYSDVCSVALRTTAPNASTTISHILEYARFVTASFPNAYIAHPLFSAALARMDFILMTTIDAQLALSSIIALTALHPRPVLLAKITTASISMMAANYAPKSSTAANFAKISINVSNATLMNTIPSMTNAENAQINSKIVQLVLLNLAANAQISIISRTENAFRVEVSTPGV